MTTNVDYVSHKVSALIFSAFFLPEWPWLLAMQKNPPDHISVGLHDDKLDVWEVMIYGPPESLL